MRVAYAGSPTAAVAPLEALVASRHEMALVISQPDRPRGRRGTPRPTPVAEAAERRGLPLLRPESINSPDAMGALDAARIDALVVVAFGQILREGVLSARPCVNVHFSLLPAYRGAAPVERAMMDGVGETGVTIMLMDAGLDTGPMLAARRTPVHDDDTGGALTERLSHIGAELLVETLSAFAAGDLAPRAQPDEGVSLAPKITADDRALDPLKPARLVARQIQALSPHIGVTAQIDGRPFKLWSARVSDAEPPAAGTMATHEGRLVLGCGAGAVEILRLQPPGRGPLAAADFLRGWRGDLALQPRDG